MLRKASKVQVCFSLSFQAERSLTPQLETVIIEVTRSIPVFSITEGSRYTLLIVCKYCGVIPILFGWFLRALSLYQNKTTCTTISNHRLSYTYEKHSYNAIASFTLLYMQWLCLLLEAVLYT